MPLAAGAETRVVLDNVSWETFEQLLASTGPGRGRLAYDQGTLEIMSPSLAHELLKGTLGCLLEAYAQEMGLDMQLVGSTTLKLELKRRGLEPDESYYVQNEPRMRGKLDFNLGEDPPPDLAIEIQISRSALDKLGIYGSLGVPEVWLWEEDALKLHVLDDEGSYSVAERSRALPDLPVLDLLRFVARAREVSTTRLANEFREWLRSRPAI